MKKPKIKVIKKIIKSTSHFSAKKNKENHYIMVIGTGKNRRAYDMDLIK